MLSKLIKKIQLQSAQNKKENTNYWNETSKPLQIFSKDINVNLNKIKDAFKGASDIIFREFKIGTEQQLTAVLVVIDGLVDKGGINESIIKPLMFLQLDMNKTNTFMFIKERVLPISKIKESTTLEESVGDILSGDALLLIDGSDIGLIISMRGWESRGVDEPGTETVVRGPKEGFVETIAVNIALLRRKIKSINLTLETMKIGKLTQTEICIAYLKGIADEKIVNEVKKRLTRIETDSILESGYIEAFIEDAPFSIFPTIGNGEKPDVISAKILEGRVAILVDGTPFVLTVPYLFVEAFQNSEDYYSRPFYASFLRSLRWVAFFISVFLPAIFVATTTYHQELLPPALAISIAAAQEGTPFPSVVEAFLMQLIYEVLREAGVRLPRPVGQAVSIVGALVIGEASVTAGVIGAPMVVVVGATAIASFVVPPLSDVSAIFRLLMIILSGFAGGFGVMMGVAVMLVNLCSLRSFGVIYTSSIAPATLSDMKDVFIRVPWWAMLARPRSLRPQNIVRQKSNLKTEPLEIYNKDRND